jgi:hypothetical protein
MTITSTRSNESADARRDFDGFDADEELRRLRSALRDGEWRIVAELAANLDEHLCRGGSFPVAWFGPFCMQEESALAACDLAARLASSAEVAAKMSRQARREATAGYVALPPAPAKFSGSGVGLYCNHDQHRFEGGCPERLSLERTTAVQPTHEDDYQQLMPALDEAAVLLGWRLYKSVWWCPTHVAAKRLACTRCRLPCPACSCMGGPRADAVESTNVEGAGL